jgi:hypothetical protein
METNMVGRVIRSTHVIAPVHSKIGATPQP